MDRLLEDNGLWGKDNNFENDLALALAKKDLTKSTLERKVSPTMQKKAKVAQVLENVRNKKIKKG